MLFCDIVRDHAMEWIILISIYLIGNLFGLTDFASLMIFLILNINSGVLLMMKYGGFDFIGCGGWEEN